MTDFTSRSSSIKTESGTKARQRDDTEDRSLVYRDWRRESVGKGKKRSTCYTSDLDQVEYVIHKDEVYPVAIIELTRYDMEETDMAPHSWAKYRQSILDRYFIRDAQGKFIKKLSNLIGVPAYIVLFQKNLTSFWLFDVNDTQALWIHKTPEEYREWLASLKTAKVKDLEAYTVKDSTGRTIKL